MRLCSHGRPSTPSVRAKAQSNGAGSPSKSPIVVVCAMAHVVSPGRRTLVGVALSEKGTHVFFGPARPYGNLLPRYGSTTQFRCRNRDLFDRICQLAPTDFA